MATEYMSVDYLTAAIRYEKTFVRHGEKAIARGEDVCPEWLGGHRRLLSKYEADLATVRAGA